MYKRLYFDLAANSAAHDLGTLDASSGISCVYHKLGFTYDALIVIIGVIRDDQHAVVLAEIIQRGALHLQVVLAAFSDRGEIRVVVPDISSLLL